MATEHRRLMEELERVAARDGRYDPEAYYFIFRALDHTLKTLGRGRYSRSPSDDEEDRHVSGQELLEGIRQLALEDFGLMAKTVFHHWGIRRTEDFGTMVFNLVESGLMGKTEQDSLQDFANGYDFDEAFERDVKLDTRIRE